MPLYPRVGLSVKQKTLGLASASVPTPARQRKQWLEFRCWAE